MKASFSLMVGDGASAPARHEDLSSGHWKQRETFRKRRRVSHGRR